MPRAVGPDLHLFVCANRRDADAELGPGCGDRGDALYAALKNEVASRGLVARVWVTKTHCLGVCPREGATVARYPGSPAILSEIVTNDAPSLLVRGTENETERAALRDASGIDEASADAIETELTALEALQSEKVLALARRLKPGLTLEDVRNPHDFPELDDPDWHYADGVLSGIKSALSALRATRAGRAARDRSPR